MSATQEEDTKHRLGGAHINLKVKGHIQNPLIFTKPEQSILLIALRLQDGNEVFYRIKSSTQLKKLMDAYDF
ncbi:hypothetical protein IGI04_019635 [Brassica rapa subsp. trilocularis]|uniref:FERM domain-containing protein n=1 Tax=Brassica rapa subsp. trilocularis TaxID=1813537 RepID=A0ABQ7MJT9_BRACM|nr:hypothetical protein IGI04_019635 [Brassica rapa subsp. trilocularis]